MSEKVVIEGDLNEQVINLGEGNVIETPQGTITKPTLPEGAEFVPEEDREKGGENRGISVAVEGSVGGV